MNNLQPETKTVALDDAAMSFLDYEGGTPAVVLLHATGFIPWLWHPVARRLAPKHRVIAPAFCNYRDAKPEDGGLGWTILAKDLSLLCRSLNLTEAWFVGHSMGGTIATLAEALYDLHAKGLILIEPIFLPEELYASHLTLDRHPLAFRAMKRTNHWKTKKEAADYLQSKSFFTSWHPEVITLYLEQGMVPGKEGGLELRCPPRQEAALFMGGMRHNPWPCLPKITCPVSILEGSESENRDYIDLSRAAASFSNSSYRRIEGAGHLIPMENPGVTAEMIASFIAESETARQNDIER